jgi:hypothetical protein
MTTDDPDNPGAPPRRITVEEFATGTPSVRAAYRAQQRALEPKNPYKVEVEFSIGDYVASVAYRRDYYARSLAAMRLEAARREAAGLSSCPFEIRATACIRPVCLCRDPQRINLVK